MLSSCFDSNVDQDKPLEISQEKIDHLGITNPDYLSAASKRALEWPDIGNEWFVEFKEFDLKGDLAYEEGVVRRDPSALIKEDGRYFVWYSKSTGESQGFGGDIENDKVFPWDRCDIWYATSVDGWTWKEEGLAVPRGHAGSYDDRSVFTTEIMKHEGKYYLEINRMLDEQVRPYLLADNGVWEGEEQNRFKVIKKGDFDSHKVHDPCLVPYKGKFYLYYKGEQMGEEITFGGRQIRHGVAIANNPLGPYVKSKYNPISNSGHEICVWPYKGGISSLITTDGPEKNTVQWSPDGINFEIMSVIKGAPHAIGLNRSHNIEDTPLSSLEWGLTHRYASGDWQYIRRFEGKRRTSHVAKGASK